MAERKKTNKDGGTGVDLLDKEKAKNKAKPPKKYKVVYHNDDYTPMELVVISLVAFFRRSNEDAFKIMMHVHEKLILSPYHIVATTWKKLASLRTNESLGKGTLCLRVSCQGGAL